MEAFLKRICLKLSPPASDDCFLLDLECTYDCIWLRFHSLDQFSCGQESRVELT
jgi:hypothetical protein